jgi:membrane-associated HD superfamily phosphohydrolase
MRAMKFFPIIFMFSLQNAFLSVAFPQDIDPYVSNEYMFEDYKTKEYKSDWKTTFPNSEDLTNFKRLREYLQKKKDISQYLEDELSLIPQTSFSKKIENYLNTYDRAIKGRKDTEETTVDAYIPELGLNYSYYYTTIGDLKNNILPQLKEIKTKAEAMDAENKSATEKLKKNIDLIKADIFLCEKQIDSSLAPEYHQQAFRIEISITFAILIGILLIVFFLLIYTKSDKNLAVELLSGNGLQFMTLFVLIIAITLFGILNILEGRELAAILAGISGYILGRGVKGLKDDDTKEAS